MVANHRVLNDLCHKMDATRPTTMAHAFMLDPNDDFVFLSDIRSYNLYFGWYIGEKEQNDSWFDDFHAAHPDQVIGLSEFGADANPAYQSAKPREGGLDRELSGGLSRAYACHVEGAPLHLGHACVEYVRLCGRWKK